MINYEVEKYVFQSTLIKLPPFFASAVLEDFEKRQDAEQIVLSILKDC